jgi:hypothetical protein
VVMPKKNSRTEAAADAGMEEGRQLCRRQPRAAGIIGTAETATFRAGGKLRILGKTDRAANISGISAILRREGVTHSLGFSDPLFNILRQPALKSAYEAIHYELIGFIQDCRQSASELDELVQVLIVNSPGIFRRYGAALIGDPAAIFHHIAHDLLLH